MSFVIEATGLGACMASRGIREAITYQPASRYWPFQWIETGMAYDEATGTVVLFGGVKALFSGACCHDVADTWTWG